MASPSDSAVMKYARSKKTCMTTPQSALLETAKLRSEMTSGGTLSSSIPKLHSGEHEGSGSTRSMSAAAAAVGVNSLMFSDLGVDLRAIRGSTRFKMDDYARCGVEDGLRVLRRDDSAASDQASEKVLTLRERFSPNRSRVRFRSALRSIPKDDVIAE